MKTILLLAGLFIIGSTAIAQDLRFEENKGQVIDTDGNLRPDILFRAESNGVQAYLRKDGLSYVFAKQNGPKGPDFSTYETEMKYYEEHPSFTTSFHRVDVNFVGANENAFMRMSQANESYNNYYLAHCPDGITNVQSYGQVTYIDIYPNIDLSFYTKDGHMKYDFIVHPGGNPMDIQIQLDGDDNAVINEDGDLVIETTMGTITEEAPYTYQRQGAKVNSSFSLVGDKLTFQLGDYNDAEDLIIDPSLLWATYYGGNGSDYYGKKVDVNPSNGDVYASFRTNSSTFPVTAGAYDVVLNSYDASLSRFDKDGNQLWATYFGGSSTEEVWGVVVDNVGDIILGSCTLSSDVPTTTGAYDETYNAGWDNVASKFADDGTLIWSTVLGGSNHDLWSDVTVDSNNDVIIGGMSGSSNYPTTAGAYDTGYNGGYDLAISKLSSDGSTLNWSTFIGGTGDENTRLGLAVDSNDDVIVSGCTNTNSFPTTAGAFDVTHNGSWDWTLSKLSNDGATLLISTFVGGSSDDGNQRDPDVTVDGSDNIYIAGMCLSTDMPITAGAYQDTDPAAGWQTGFISKFDNSGAQIWGTYYGGATHNNWFSDIDFANGRIYAVGGVYATDLPMTADAHQPTKAGSNWDNFITEWDTDGNLTYSTYYGGIDYDRPEWVGCAYGAGQLVVVGEANSNNWPNTVGAFDETHNGSDDGTILAFRFCDIQLTLDGSTDVLCHGEATGSIDVTATTGSESPLSYLWSDGSTTEDLSAVVAGDYSLTVTGGVTGCTVDLQTVTISEPDTITSSITGTDPTCFGLSNGSADLTVGGGIAPYDFLWESGGTSEDESSLSDGTWTVTITDDSGCIYEDSVTLTEPADITATFDVTTVLCNGDSTGAVDMTPAGGIGTLSYEWSTADLTEDLADVPAGSYTVLITDGNGCISFQSVSVNEPDELSLDFDVMDVLCHGDTTGMIDLTVNGGTLGFEYLWSTTDTTEDIMDLGIGNYTVMVTDTNGCTITDSAEVFQPDSIIIDGTAVMETLGGDGEVHVIVSGGIPSYSYSWDNGELVPDIFGLTEGTYTVTVTDANGCVDSATFTVDSQLGIGTSSVEGVMIYPNPTNRTVNISMNNSTMYAIEMYDAAGALVYNSEINSNTYLIDMQAYESGSYHIKLITSGGVLYQRLIKN